MILINNSESFTDKNEMLEIIKDRVRTMLSNKPDLLMSYLYRLDILEYKIKEVLCSKKVDPVDGLSQLILDRQLARIETKKKYKQNPIKGMEW